jgi:hypothetical protein
MGFFIFCSTGLPFFGMITCLSAMRVANEAGAIRPVALPRAEGAVVAAAFSPDSGRLANIRHVAVPGASRQRHVLQIVDLKSRHEASNAEVLNGEAPIWPQHRISSRIRLTAAIYCWRQKAPMFYRSSTRAGLRP